MGHEDALITTGLGLLGLLLLASVSALLLKRLRFPYTVGLVVVGLGLAFVAEAWAPLDAAFAPLQLEPVVILFVFVPVLIFESAFDTDVRVLSRNVVPSLVLATVGLLVSTAAIGGLVAWLTPLPLGPALIFGCLISATDPVAVIALFRDVGAPRRLMVLVEGESLFNDATAIVTYGIILSAVTTGIVDAPTVTDGIVRFVVVFLGGLVVGLGFGYLLAMAIRVIGDEPLVHITLTLVVAYSGFIVSEHFLHLSGIMAVLGAGLVLGYYGSALYSRHVKEYLHVFWENAAFVANSLIFLMLGLSERVFVANVGANPAGLLVPMLVVVVVVLAVRAVVVLGLVPLATALPGQRMISRAYQVVMWWGGLRGAVAIALAISLPGTFPFRWQIIDFTFGVTLFTLLVNATTMRPLMVRLGLDRPPPLTDYVRTHLEVQRTEAALVRLDAHHAGREEDELARRVRTDHERRLGEATRRLATLREALGRSRAVRRDLLWLRAFGIARAVHTTRHADGLLSYNGLRTLEWELAEREARVHDADELTPGPPDLPATLADRRLTVGARLSSALPRSRRQALADAYELLTAIADAAIIVGESVGHLEAFSGAEEEDVVALQGWFATRGDAAAARAEELGERFAEACLPVRMRQLEAVAGARQPQVIDLTGSEAVSDVIAERLESAVEAGTGGGG